MCRFKNKLSSHDKNVLIYRSIYEVTERERPDDPY